ncbi:phosphatase PAP2 family protein [Salinithrix halophila]|uniref:phosphatase PAP2 family protein n=1 Tax=Salinithrix halophila TaxID=1485204 RepID=UPI0036D24B11
MFQSGTTILLTSLLTFLTVLLICLRKNPFIVIRDFILGLKHHRLLLFHVIACMGILLMNKLELLLEPHLNVSEDWTPYIGMFEENVTPIIQQLFMNDSLTYLTTYFYVILFSVLLFASLFIYHSERDFRSLYALLYGIGFNYLLAIPFYLFFPVNETWHSHPNIQFLIPTVYPGFEEQYRNFSGLNNSFPSLHTSLSITLAVIAWHSVNRRFARLNLLSVGVILFAILYLGIHWYLDIIAGIILASVSLGLAYWACEIPLGTPRPGLSPQRKASSEQYADLS